jgi:hypothetical protein
MVAEISNMLEQSLFKEDSKMSFAQPKVPIDWQFQCNCHSLQLENTNTPV